MFFDLFSFYINLNKSEIEHKRKLQINIGVIQTENITKKKIKKNYNEYKITGIRINLIYKIYLRITYIRIYTYVYAMCIRLNYMNTYIFYLKLKKMLY